MSGPSDYLHIAKSNTSSEGPQRTSEAARCAVGHLAGTRRLYSGILSDASDTGASIYAYVRLQNA